MEWAQAAAIIASQIVAIGVVVGPQTFWIARSLDILGDEMHRGFDRLDARIDRLEQREPPSLRRV